MFFVRGLLAIFVAVQSLDLVSALPQHDKRAGKTSTTTTTSVVKTTTSATTTPSAVKTTTTTTTTKTTKSKATTTSLSATTQATTSQTTSSSAAAACTGGTYKSGNDKYTIQCNYNFAGDGSNILGYTTGVSSVRSCIDQCEANSLCVAVDWYATSQGSGPNQAAGDCFLLSNIGVGGGSANGIQAASKPAPTCNGKSITQNGHQYTVQCNENYAGGSNIIANFVGVDSLDTCVGYCESSASCVAVDYYRTSQGSGSNQVAGNCFLLSNTNNGQGSANGIDAASKGGSAKTSTSTTQSAFPTSGSITTSTPSIVVTTTTSAPSIATTTSTTPSVATTSSTTSSTFATTTMTTTAVTTTMAIITTTTSSSSATTTPSTTPSTTAATTTSSTAATTPSTTPSTTPATTVVTTTSSTPSLTTTTPGCTPSTYYASPNSVAFDIECDTNYGGTILYGYPNVPSVQECADLCDAWEANSGSATQCEVVVWYHLTLDCYLLANPNSQTGTPDTETDSAVRDGVSAA